MFGYITKLEAIENGFTHEGKYFGIPCWIAPNNDFMVAAKWEPMEYVMSAFHVIEQFVRGVMYPEDDPCFQFLLGKEIE